MTIKAVVFDFDGTLVDSAPGLLAAANSVPDEWGYPGIELDDVKSMIGDGMAMFSDR